MEITIPSPFHTPGPWALQQIAETHHGYDWQTFAVRSPGNNCIALVGDVDRFESERIPANARLIAAAPELLAALSGLVDVLGESETMDHDLNGCDGCALCSARAAIAACYPNQTTT